MAEHNIAWCNAAIAAATVLFHFCDTLAKIYQMMEGGIENEGLDYLSYKNQMGEGVEIITRWHCIINAKIKTVS